jgi:hypothetical protein
MNNTCILCPVFRLIQYRRGRKTVDTEYTYYSWCMTSTDIVKWRKRNDYEIFLKRGVVKKRGEEETKSMPCALLCITVLGHRIICCQIFCDLLLKSAFERIFNVMHLILVKIKWHITGKWKYLIKKFHDICFSYYFIRDRLKMWQFFSNEVSFVW